MAFRTHESKVTIRGSPRLTPPRTRTHLYSDNALRLNFGSWDPLKARVPGTWISQSHAEPLLSGTKSSASTASRAARGAFRAFLNISLQLTSKPMYPPHHHRHTTPPTPALSCHEPPARLRKTIIPSSRTGVTLASKSA